MIISLKNVIFDNDIHFPVFKYNIKANIFKKFVKLIFLKRRVRN